MSNQLTAMLMKKHLRLHNKYVRDDLVISGIAKMKKEQVKKMFDRVFKQVGSGDDVHYKSKEYRNFDADIPIPELKKLMIKQPKKEKKKPEPEPEPAPEPKKKKIIKIKRKVKDGQVVGGSVDGKPIQPKKKIIIKKKKN